MIDYSESSKIIQKGLMFLNEFGFEKSEICFENSKMAGEGISFSYKSKKVDLTLDVTFWKAQLGQISTFVVLIENDNDRLDLGDWLKEKGKEKEIPLYNSSNIQEEIFIKKFISSFKRLCRSDLKEILEGRRWDEVPFDWGDYR